jgi:hypothetical protein
MALAEDLLAIEQQFWTGGPEVYRRHADERCLVAFAETAGVMSNEEIANSAEEGRWMDVRLQPRGMALLFETAAVITYECTARRKDGERYRALVSSGYSKLPEGWKLAFHQQTGLKV